jgi:hypothetical protein
MALSYPFILRVINSDASRPGLRESAVAPATGGLEREGRSASAIGVRSVILGAGLDLWPRWRDALHIVRPETVIRWHREGFRRHWTRKCRSKGRPVLDPKVRELIRRMSQANPLWGAPRIHGELLRLGIEISQTSVAKYMIRNRKSHPPVLRKF